MYHVASFSLNPKDGEIEQWLNDQEAQGYHFVQASELTRTGTILIFAHNPAMHPTSPPEPQETEQTQPANRRPRRTSTQAEGQ